jgi:hypothetical protein
MTNLSKRFRQELNGISTVSAAIPAVEESPGWNKKFLFGLEDGNRIEAS